MERDHLHRRPRVRNLGLTNITVRVAFAMPSVAEKSWHPCSSVFICGQVFMNVIRSHLKDLDYSVVQQCIHCGMCLPTCPTYDATRLERNSPRGRIALMRNVAEGHLDVTRAFGEELYFCLGCLACETACPAGVNYARMFEEARADIEEAGVLRDAKRDLVRAFALRFFFAHL